MTNQTHPITEIEKKVLLQEALKRILFDEALYQKAMALKEQVEKAHIRTELLQKEPTWGTNILALMGSILLFPCWINSLWPNLFMWLIGKSFTFRKEDPMWEGTFLFAINALFVIPIFYIGTFIVTGIYASWWAAALFILLAPLYTLLAWYYVKWNKRLFQNFTALRSHKNAAWNQMKATYNDIKNSLNTLL